MAFTTSDDLNILQASDTNNVGAGAGNDTYIINASSTSNGQVINITDTEGTNVIKLVGGVTITSSVAAANVVQLTLSNGAVINVLGADAFTFEIGGDAFTTGSGTSQTFTEFVTQSLGIAAVPTGSDTAAGNANVTTNTDGTVTGGGTSTTTGTFALTAGATSVDEGATATFSLATTGVTTGTAVAYTLTGIDAADLASGSLTGTATVDSSGAATISVALAADTTTEGVETLTVTIDNQTATASTTVNDTSLAGGSTFVLTSGTDDFSTTSTPALTSSNDTGTGTLNTLTSNDSIVDGSTTDDDILTVELVASVDATAKITNIETLVFNALSGTQTVDNTLMTGVNTIEHTGTGSLALTNVQSASTNYKMTGTASSLTATVIASSLTGASDSAVLELSDTTAGTFTAAGAVETVIVTSSGTSANTITDIIAANASTITFSGTQKLTLTGDLAATFTTVDARNLQVDLDITGATTTALLSGSADDIVDLTGVALNANQLFSMGAGSDTLILRDSTGGGTATLQGIETIQTKDGAATDIDLANADQAVNIDINGAATGVTVDNMATGSTIKSTTALAGTGASSISFGANQTSTVLNLDIQNGSAASGTGGAITFTNVNDLTITAGAVTDFNNLVLDETSTDGSQNTQKVTLSNTSSGAFNVGDITLGDDVTDFTINQTGTGSTTAGTFIDAEKLTSLTINATTGTAGIGAFGGTTASTVLSSIDINAGKDVSIASGGINAQNSAGITTVSIDATGGTVSTASSHITNTGGNIGTATLTGSKTIDIDLLTATSGRVETVNASATTGNVTLFVTNASVAGSTGSTITLGNASSGNTNSVTLNSSMNDTITGGTGIDSIVLADGATAESIGTNTVSLGTGTDTLSFAGQTVQGVVVNMSTATQYLNGETAATAETDEIIGALKAYDRSTSDSNIDTTSGASVTTFSGLENIIGTNQEDVIIGDSADNEITGGRDTDTVTGGAGSDTFIFGTSATDLVNYAGADTTTTNIDSIADFVAGTDKVQITDTVTFANLTMASATTGFSVNESSGTLISAAAISIAAGAADITALTALMNTAAVTAIASTAGAAGAATGIQAYTFVTTAGSGGFDGKTFLVINDDTAALAATDVIIDVTGVSGNIVATDFQIA